VVLPSEAWKDSSDYRGRRDEKGGRYLWGGGMGGGARGGSVVMLVGPFFPGGERESVGGLGMLKQLNLQKGKAFWSSGVFPGKVYSGRSGTDEGSDVGNR